MAESRVGQRAREHGHLARAAEGLRGGARPVGGQVEQRRRAGQARAPEVDHPPQRLAAQLLALPRRVIAVLRGERGQRRRLAAQEGTVQGAQLAQEHAQAPPVAHRVVHRQHQQVIVGGQAEEAGAEERPGREVEGGQRLGAGQRLQGLGVGAGRALHREGHRRGRGHHLHRLALAAAQRGAQRLVARPPQRRARGRGRRCRAGRAAGRRRPRCRRRCRAPSGRGTTAAAARTRAERCRRAPPSPGGSGRAGRASPRPSSLRYRRSFVVACG